MKWALGVGGTLGVAGVVIWGAARCGPATMPARAKVVRKSALAGAWYAGTATGLAKQVDRLLVGATAVSLPPGRPAYLIQPHAGYVYSGRAAATGLKSITKPACDRVVILAPTHRAAFAGASIPNVTHYATPLGEIPLDTDVCTALLKHRDINTVAEAHALEHAVEIELPLLQWAYGDHPPLEKFRKTDTVRVPFRLVPIVFGRCAGEQLDAIAKALKPHIGPRTLVMVSSDFTHYGRDFGYVPFRTDIKKNLAKLTGDAVNHILAKDTAGLERYLAKTGATICGRVPIRVMLRMLPAGAVGKQLISYTSGDVTGVWSSCVSYVSLVFCVPEKAPAGTGLSTAEQQALLNLARTTLTRLVRERKATTVADAGIALTPRLREKRGVFVTLKRDGTLRGCIGYVVGAKPLCEAVIDNTVNAATRDPRFPAVTADELVGIHIEISVMSPLVPVSDPKTIQVGKHGLLIRRGPRQGLLLPQVAAEQGWDRERFLVGVCRKAGLPADAWKTADLFSFTAQIFGEKE